MGVKDNNATTHVYGQAIVVVLLTAALTGIGAIVNRIDNIEHTMDGRIDHIVENTIDRNHLDYRFTIAKEKLVDLELRVRKLEKRIEHGNDN